MKNQTRERAAQLFGAMSHTTRLRIVELLSGGAKTVNEVASALQIGQSGASQHLSILTRAGVLVVEPQGTARRYRIRGPRIAAILSLIEEFCEVHSLYGMAEDASDHGTSEMADGGEGRRQRAEPAP